MLVQFIFFSLFIVSPLIVRAIFYLTSSLFIHLDSHSHCSFILIYYSHSRHTFCLDLFVFGMVVWIVYG